MICQLACDPDAIKNNQFMGLCWNAKQLDLVKEAFPCCGGRAYRWDAQQRVVRFCPLARRKKAVDRLVEQFQATWGGYNPIRALSPENADYFLRWIKDFQRERIGYGYRFTAPSPKAKPSMFWSLATLAIWNFGLSAHVFTLARSKPAQIHPRTPAKGPTGRLVYFLEGVKDLWKPELSEQVTAIIHWCEQSKVPLWIELKEESPTRLRPDELNVAKMLKNRISHLKGRPELEWLGNDVHSRIDSISHKLWG